MKTLIVELEFDDNELGPEWMNIYNLKSLLYSGMATKPELLSVKITGSPGDDKPEPKKVLSFMGEKYGLT